MTNRKDIALTIDRLQIGDTLRIEKPWQVRAPLVTGPELQHEGTVTLTVTRSSYGKFTITVEPMPADMALELADRFARFGVPKK